MASVFSHAIAALALGTTMRPEPAPPRYWALGATLAALPDADVVAFAFGHPYDTVFGHRGLTHSLVFAAAAASVAVWGAFARLPAAARRRIWVFLFLATVSHGVLDAMTSGGGGIAFFAPFSSARYFLPWRPILVSPIGLRPFLSDWGVAVLANEARWIWLPAALVATAAAVVRIARRAPAPSERSA